MKEDKENTRPREKRVELKVEDVEKTEKPKEKKEAMTKVLVARLASYSNVALISLGWLLASLVA